ncbi:hypothetical protein [Gilvimarinus sp. 1_MG-2023]|uniref:hypothetical protein n=1 Tax=Gilvimarinus sp. 1_MG-2023 TaxID=3062638 RepID=UPI0026E17B88|nr:hypothetical protein [Gilvimarinus sp. 1_MG-2023]MDO6746791.1 hypothetical protein [Gilvimarinus sp. 1_MG-2023]
MPALTKQNGVALALLLWFLAAMAILVAGLMGLSRLDSQSVRMYMNQARAESLGDAAMRLVASGLVEVSGADTPLQGEVLLDGYRIWVRIVPQSGLVDVLAADVETLAAVFTGAANLEAAEALALAESVVEWRAPSGEGNEREGPPTVGVLEDVMGAPGFTRTVFEYAKWYLCVDCNGGKLDPATMSDELRVMLQATGAENQPENDGSAHDQLRLREPSRVDTRLSFGGDAIFQRSAWLQPGKGIGRRYPAFKVQNLQFESDSFVEE